MKSGRSMRSYMVCSTPISSMSLSHMPNHTTPPLSRTGIMPSNISCACASRRSDSASSCVTTGRRSFSMSASVSICR